MMFSRLRRIIPLFPAILHSMDTRRQDVRPFSGSLLLCIHSQEEGKFIS